MTMMTLVTQHGPLDLCFAPAGFDRGYEQLASRVVIMRRADVEIPVAPLD
jgi:hypothetical protein